MKQQKYTVYIKAPAEKVYRTMLGLDNKQTYNDWTSAFNPTSSYEGSWEKGSKIHFAGTDENGKVGGMVSEIAENWRAEFVSIRHYGILDGDKEITSGEMVEKWAGGFENYSFREQDGVTTVTVEVDVTGESVDYFTNTYPSALDKLKKSVEGSSPSSEK